MLELLYSSVSGNVHGGDNPLLGAWRRYLCTVQLVLKLTPMLLHWRAIEAQKQIDKQAMGIFTSEEAPETG